MRRGAGVAGGRIGEGACGRRRCRCAGVWILGLSRAAGAMSVILGALRLTCWLSCLILLIGPTCTLPEDELRQSPEDALYEDEPPLSPDDDEDFVDANTTGKRFFQRSLPGSTMDQKNILRKFFLIPQLRIFFFFFLCNP